MDKNIFGYPIINRDSMDKYFGQRPKELSPDNYKTIVKQLRKLDVPIPVDYDENLIDYEIPIPPLLGNNIYEHYEEAAKKFIKPSVDNIDEFIKNDIPQFPSSLLEFKNGQLLFNGCHIKPGWTKFFFKDWSVKPVDVPEEEVFVFDTETFVRWHNYPIMGTAVSSEGYYLWLAREVLTPSLTKDLWDQQHFIPVGKNKTILAHNSSFDRVRTQEAYVLGKSPNIWFDTLSCHVCTSGLASGQRYFFALKAKDFEDLSNKEKKRVRYAPDWSDKGSTNSLVQCYNFHVAEFTHHEKLTIKDKKVRDLFVTARRMEDINAELFKLTVYAINDVYYTFLLAKYLWPKYRENSPSYTSLAGHAYLLGSKIPLTKNWKSWITNCESIYNELQKESSSLITQISKGLYDEWIKRFQLDLKNLEKSIRDNGYDILLDGAEPEKAIEFIESHGVLHPELWDKKNKKWKSTLVLNKDGKFRKPSINRLISLYTLLNPNWAVISNSIFKDDVWYNQLDWSPSKYLGKWTPAWYKNWIKDPNYAITNKSVTMHILLRLTWRGFPVVKTPNNGFCFITDTFKNDLDEPLLYKTDNGQHVYKIPHKKGWDDNVGVLLSKDYLPYYEAKILDGKEAKAGRVLEIGVITSYWTSIRKRVMNRFVREVYNPFGDKALITLPEITPAGTVTRRSVEPLFLTMCGTKPHKLA
ncbi:MAG: hypothetical protein R3321_00750 [Nitrososphaeraceae archaeon]|nr:hypothetical protein [Nitrososphaeraceae archaeon]